MLSERVSEDLKGKKRRRVVEEGFEIPFIFIFQEEKSLFVCLSWGKEIGSSDF